MDWIYLAVDSNMRYTVHCNEPSVQLNAIHLLKEDCTPWSWSCNKTSDNNGIPRVPTEQSGLANTNLQCPKSSNAIEEFLNRTVTSRWIYCLIPEFSVSEDHSIYQQKNKLSDFAEEMGVHRARVLFVGQETSEHCYLLFRYTTDTKSNHGWQQQMMQQAH